MSEGAISAKWAALNLPPVWKNRNGSQRWHTFGTRLEELGKQGVIPKADLDWWENARKRRNSGSHPTRQSLMAPGFLVSTIALTAEHINRLFP